MIRDIIKSRAKRPNAETRTAMEELERGDGKKFATIEQLFADWRK